MKCSSGISTVYALLVTIIFLPRFNSTELHLDDVIDDVIEKLFGSALHDEFDEFTKNCLNYDAAFKKAETCIANLNFSYDRIDRKSPDGKLCEDLTSASKCLASLIEALKSCDGERQVHMTLEAVAEGMNASLWYFCNDKAAKLIQLYKEGFPRCFVRGPGRQLASCFPGRQGQLSPSNYWSAIEEDQFFNPQNCRLLRSHTDCAVSKLKQCAFNNNDVSAFQGAIETVMDQVLCSTESHSSPSQKGAGSKLPGLSPSWLFMAAFLVLLLPSSLVGITPRFLY